jgi:uncharacterized protein YbjT (DUF2867 family)
VAAAVCGCTTVISAVHGFAGPGKPSPGAVDRDANRALIHAAAAAGVQHLVLVSVLAAAGDHPMSLHRAKYAAEQALRASGLPWTIIRPAAYLETWVAVIGARLAAGGPALVFGPGRNPINFVSAHDVAAAVDLAVHDQALRGQVLEVAGPENLTLPSWPSGSSPPAANPAAPATSRCRCCARCRCWHDRSRRCSPGRPRPRSS